jgi:hypothetical protein
MMLRPGNHRGEQSSELRFLVTAERPFLLVVRGFIKSVEHRSQRYVRRWLSTDLNPGLGTSSVVRALLVSRENFPSKFKSYDVLARGRSFVVYTHFTGLMPAAPTRVTFLIRRRARAQTLWRLQIHWSSLH